MTLSRQDKRDRFLNAVRDGPVVMGILNVTPDSFSDGGRHDAPGEALAHAVTMASEGCAIIDIGGESTRPGAMPVPEAEELARIGPAVNAICAALDVAVSVDTYKATVARRAAELGASVINDVWGLQRDPQMADVVAETGSAVIVMHNRPAVDATIDIMADVRRFFEASLTLALQAGIPEGHIILDPGIGFGKSLDQNLTCLHRLDQLREFGKPILLGLSRKSMIGRILGTEVGDRLIGTLAANMLGLTRGARILRVHDVAEHVAAVKIFNATEAAQ